VKTLTFKVDVNTDMGERLLREQFAEFCRSRGYAVVTTEEKAAGAEKLSMALSGSVYDYAGDSGAGSGAAFGLSVAEQVEYGRQRGLRLSGAVYDPPADDSDPSKVAASAVEAFIERKKSEGDGSGLPSDVAAAMKAKIAPELARMLSAGQFSIGAIDRAVEIDGYLAGAAQRVRQLLARGLTV
jgi:hypothetical protein